MNLGLRDINQALALHQTRSQLAAAASNSQAAALAGFQETIHQFAHDGILTDLNALHHNPRISQSVSQILSAYVVTYMGTVPVYFNVSFISIY